PPQQSLIFLVSHAPGRELPTIRSRCRRLLLRPLDADDVTLALAEATGKDRRDDDVREAAGSADGSVGRALALREGHPLALRQRVLDLLAQLPNVDTRALHALGDAMGGTDPKMLEAFMDLINGWLSKRLGEAGQEKAQMARVAEAWERINIAARNGDNSNLERKPLVFAVFGVLAEAG